MPESTLAGWESFYVILGSSAAALTGLQFVVMALVADMPRAGSMHDIATYGTPRWCISAPRCSSRPS